MTLKGFRKEFVAVKKSRKVSGLVIYPCLTETLTLQQLKGCKVLNLACQRDTICQWKVYERGIHRIFGQ